MMLMIETSKEKIETQIAHLLKVFEPFAISFAFSDKAFACLEISLASFAVFTVSISRLCDSIKARYSS